MPKVMYIKVNQYGNPTYILKNFWRNGSREVITGSEAYEFDWQSYLQYWDGKIRKSGDSSI